MADKIHISPEVVHERAEQFRMQAEALKEIIVSMDGYMDQLREEWEGDSSTAFMARFTEIRPGFLAAEDMMREIASALDKNATRFQNTDERLARQFQ